MALLRAFQVRNRINQFKRHFVIILTSYPLQGWQRARVDGDERRFCARHQISSSTMEMVTGMRTQLLGQLRASGFVRAKGPGDIRDLNKNSENWAVVKAALVAGSQEAGCQEKCRTAAQRGRIKCSAHGLRPCLLYASSGRFAAGRAVCDTSFLSACTEF